MEVKERMKAVLEYLGISGLALAKELNINPNSIKQITGGYKRKIDEELASAIVSKYNQIDKLWLLTGDGEMLLPEMKKESSLEDSVLKMINEQNALFQRQLEIMQCQNRTMHEEFMVAIKILRELGIEIKSRSEDCEANEK